MLHFIPSDDKLLFAKGQVSVHHSKRGKKKKKNEAFEDASTSQLQFCSGGAQNSIMRLRAETKKESLVNLFKTTAKYTPGH